ncbi:MAG: hypothetical protein AAF244_02535 [Pseudomonadota bacterium]
MSVFDAAKAAVIIPEPYIDETKLSSLAAQFRNPDNCRGVLSKSGSSQTSFLSLLSKTANPLAEEILFNILRHGGLSEIGHDHYQFCVELISSLTTDNRFKLLSETAAAGIVLSEGDHGWNDNEVIAWMDGFTSEQRAIVLKEQPYFVERFLINLKYGYINGKNIPSLKRWLDDMPDENKAGILSNRQTARNIIYALDVEGVELVKEYTQQHDYDLVFYKSVEEEGQQAERASSIDDLRSIEACSSYFGAASAKVVDDFLGEGKNWWHFYGDFEDEVREMGSAEFQRHLGL